MRLLNILSVAAFLLSLAISEANLLGMSGTGLLKMPGQLQANVDDMLQERGVD